MDREEKHDLDRRTQAGGLEGTGSGGVVAGGDATVLDIEGNETAGEWARQAAESVGGSVARDCLREDGFAHLTRTAMEAWSAG